MNKIEQLIEKMKVANLIHKTFYEDDENCVEIYTNYKDHENVIINLNHMGKHVVFSLKNWVTLNPNNHVIKRYFIAGSVIIDDKTFGMFELNAGNISNYEQKIKAWKVLIDKFINDEKYGKKEAMDDVCLLSLIADKHSKDLRQKIDNATSRLREFINKEGDK